MNYNCIKMNGFTYKSKDKNHKIILLAHLLYKLLRLVATEFWSYLLLSLGDTSHTKLALQGMDNPTSFCGTWGR